MNFIGIYKHYWADISNKKKFSQLKYKTDSFYIRTKMVMLTNFNLYELNMFEVVKSKFLRLKIPLAKLKVNIYLKVTFTAFD